MTSTVQTPSSQGTRHFNLKDWINSKLHLEDTEAVNAEANTEAHADGTNHTSASDDSHAVHEGVGTQASVSEAAEDTSFIEQLEEVGHDIQAQFKDATGTHEDADSTDANLANVGSDDAAHVDPYDDLDEAAGIHAETLAQIAESSHIEPDSEDDYLEEDAISLNDASSDDSLTLASTEDALIDTEIDGAESDESDVESVHDAESLEFLGEDGIEADGETDAEDGEGLNTEASDVTTLNDADEYHSEAVSQLWNVDGVDIGFVKIHLKPVIDGMQDNVHAQPLENFWKIASSLMNFHLGNSDTAAQGIDVSHYEQSPSLFTPVGGASAKQSLHSHEHQGTQHTANHVF
jgi:hypothetical protein